MTNAFWRGAARQRQAWIVAGATVALLLWQITQAFANQGVAMPWNTPLENLLSNVTGPTVTTVGAIALALAVMGWALTRNTEGVVARGISIVCAVAACMSVVQLMTALALSGAVV